MPFTLKSHLLLDAQPILYTNITTTSITIIIYDIYIATKLYILKKTNTNSKQYNSKLVMINQQKYI